MSMIKSYKLIKYTLLQFSYKLQVQFSSKSIEVLEWTQKREWSSDNRKTMDSKTAESSHNLRNYGFLKDKGRKPTDPYKTMSAVLESLPIYPAWPLTLAMTVGVSDHWDWESHCPTGMWSGQRNLQWSCRIHNNKNGELHTQVTRLFLHLLLLYFILPVCPTEM